MTPIRRTQNGWLPEIFNDFFDTEWMPKTKATAPAINVLESDVEYKVEVAAPGMCKEDFNIKINENNDLVITMEKKNEETKESKENENGKPVNVRYLRREFAYSRFQQTLILPEDVDKKKIGAKVENGVLTISLPKIVIKEEPKVAQNIEIL
ncbi:MAG: Hsp20/alpha crystallin family protein [Bacteroidaceae bacterium]|nr:Hsp20/alpha crystallin family protein [Bacteroidaceae bacterium]MCD8235319.1 Hsp20/alpha crystallin family protein [Prevotellaceae bacterium]